MTTDTTALVPIFIDQQKFELEPRVYTAMEILQLAGEDPAKTILVLRKGNELEQLAKDARVDPKPGSRFVVFHCDPTPVS